MGALEAAFRHLFLLTGSWDHDFDQFFSYLLFLCPCSSRFPVLSSPYHLHAGLIYLSMDLLWSASMSSLRPVFRGLVLRFILCFPALLSPLSYPDFSIYTPSDPTSLSLCALSFSLYGSFSYGLSCTYDFDPLLCPPYPSFSRFSFLLLAFSNCLKVVSRSV